VSEDTRKKAIEETYEKMKDKKEKSMLDMRLLKLYEKAKGKSRMSGVML